MKKIFLTASIITCGVLLSFTAGAQKKSTPDSPKPPEVKANKIAAIPESKAPVVSTTDQKTIPQTAGMKSSASFPKPIKGDEPNQQPTKTPAPEIKLPPKTNTPTRTRPA